MRRQAEEHTHPLEAHQDGEDGDSDEDGEPDEAGEDDEVGGDGDGRDHGDLTAHPVNADKFGISPEKYIFLHGTELGVKKTQSIKTILETFVNIQRVPGIMHA